MGGTAPADIPRMRSLLRPEVARGFGALQPWEGDTTWELPTHRGRAMATAAAIGIERRRRSPDRATRAGHAVRRAREDRDLELARRRRRCAPRSPAAVDRRRRDGGRGRRRAARSAGSPGRRAALAPAGHGRAVGRRSRRHAPRRGCHSRATLTIARPRRSCASSAAAGWSPRTGARCPSSTTFASARRAEASSARWTRRRSWRASWSGS